MNRVPRWRIAAAVAVLVALAGFGALFSPIYIHNLELQNFVADLTRNASARSQPDEDLRANVLKKAAELDLPVKADNVHIDRSEGLHIDVRYFVRVSLPFYTVDLHFYPGAGSR
ncbi:MAG TPA: hypothetical protein VMH28_00435 [Candidatus Acidoferrales bacterium]|nr:hypothetical protein [Candidatus Acidoferrales bacterium]